MVSSNAALSNSAYVAVLKAKQGELLAVQTTPPEHFVPLLEVIEPAKAVASIARGWPHVGHVAWVQPLSTEAEDANWAQTVADLFDGLRTAGVEAVPVTTLNEAPETYAALADIVAIDAYGLVLRLDCDEILDVDPSELRGIIDDVLGACGTAPGQTDLVLDGEYLEAWKSSYAKRPTSDEIRRRREYHLGCKA